MIPVILRPVDWHGAPFGTLQALPADSKPITLWTNRDEDTRLQFLALNSAWEIDRYHRERSSINQSALAAGLLEAAE